MRKLAFELGSIRLNFDKAIALRDSGSQPEPARKLLARYALTFPCKRTRRRSA